MRRMCGFCVCVCVCVCVCAREKVTGESREWVSVCVRLRAGWLVAQREERGMRA